MLLTAFSRFACVFFSFSFFIVFDLWYRFRHWLDWHQWEYDQRYVVSFSWRFAYKFNAEYIGRNWRFIQLLWQTIISNWLKSHGIEDSFSKPITCHLSWSSLIAVQLCFTYIWAHNEYFDFKIKQKHINLHVIHEIELPKLTNTHTIFKTISNGPINRHFCLMRFSIQKFQ